MPRRTMHLLSLLCLAALLGACAVGRTYSYTQANLGLSGVSSAGSVALAVHDERPYVISGNKPEKFVGLMRGGFGNPFDVNTQSGGALALEMRDAIGKSLGAKGVKVVPVAVASSESPARAKRALGETNARRLVLVTLREWKTDTMMNTSLHYEVKVEVMDERGAALASNAIRGSYNLGSLGLSPEEKVGAIFARKFDTLFEDEKIVEALR